MRKSRTITFLSLTITLTALGCGGRPNAANIELRKKKQKLTETVERLESQHRGDQATIKALEESKGTVPTLPSTQLAQLFTTHGIKLERLTGLVATNGAHLIQQYVDGEIAIVLPEDVAEAELIYPKPEW